MLVNVILALFLGGLVAAGLFAVLWALTRPADRIQLATACLFLSTAGYLLAAVQLLGHPGVQYIEGIVLAVIVVALYISMAALAIYYRRWAWQVAVAAFSLQVFLGIAGFKTAVAHGPTGVGGTVGWLIVGGLGLWSCFHPGSKALLGKQASA